MAGFKLVITQEDIYYKINGPYVHILAVWHSRKNRESLFS